MTSGNLVINASWSAIRAGRVTQADNLLDIAQAAATRHLLDTWEARFHLQLAYAHSELGNDTQAVASLSTASQRAPEWVRYYPLATSVVTDLLDRPNRPSSDLADLATHLRVL